MNELILKADNIEKSFQTTKKLKLEVLKSISLELEANKITVIIGASGAGKSTVLLKAVKESQQEKAHYCIF